MTLRLKILALSVSETEALQRLLFLFTTGDPCVNVYTTLEISPHVVKGIFGSSLVGHQQRQKTRQSRSVASTAKVEGGGSSDEDEG